MLPCTHQECNPSTLFQSRNTFDVSNSCLRPQQTQNFSAERVQPYLWAKALESLSERRRISNVAATRCRLGAIRLVKANRRQVLGFCDHPCVSSSCYRDTCLSLLVQVRRNRYPLTSPASERTCRTYPTRYVVPAEDGYDLSSKQELLLAELLTVRCHILHQGNSSPKPTHRKLSILPVGRVEEAALIATTSSLCDFSKPTLRRSKFWHNHGNHGCR